jgi:hypothetical protein
VKNKKNKLQWSLCRASSRRRTAKWPKTNSKTVPLPCVFWPRRTAKISSLPCVLLPGARQRVPHAVCLRCRQLLFFAVRREKTHGKDYLPCVVRRGARQRGFTMQNATVRPLSCAPTKNARQRVCRAC